MDRVGLGIGKGFAKFVPKAIRLDEIDPDQYAVSGEVVWWCGDGDVY